jgi:formate dehydrogenase subunit beta
MGTQWILETHGDPLAIIRSFLFTLWQQAELDGLLLPIYQRGGFGILPRLLKDPDQLEIADPINPFVSENSANHVARLAKENPDAHLGVVLRSCEARALAENANRGLFDLSHWILIGVDCLSSFPIDDLEWRTEKAGTLENLTRQALRFARQGNIAPYRFRQACQMCTWPSCEDVDLNIDLIGLPVKEFILISAKSENISEKLGLLDITDGPAPIALSVQHERMLDLIIERRTRCRDRKILTLERGLPSETAELIALLINCSPCQRCLEVCPIFTGELPIRGNSETVSMDEVNSWLAACVACGMCEQACPRQIPLAAIHSNIRRELCQDYLPIGMGY